VRIEKKLPKKKVTLDEPVIHDEEVEVERNSFNLRFKKPLRRYDTMETPWALQFLW
jgi:hypothetical protein